MRKKLLRKEIKLKLRSQTQLRRQRSWRMALMLLMLQVRLVNSTIPKRNSFSQKLLQLIYENYDREQNFLKPCIHIVRMELAVERSLLNSSIFSFLSLTIPYRE